MLASPVSGVCVVAGRTGINTKSCSWISKLIFRKWANFYTLVIESLSISSRRKRTFSDAAHFLTICIGIIWAVSHTSSIIFRNEILDGRCGTGSNTFEGKIIFVSSCGTGRNTLSRELISIFQSCIPRTVGYTLIS